MVSSKDQLEVAFIHPDLGIGGAERLVVDAALALKTVKTAGAKPNDVSFYTSHCDRSHCFEEIKNGEFNVFIYGDFMPTNLLGKFHILFAFLRQLYLVIKMIVTGQLTQYDLIVVDQLSYTMPLIHLFKRADAKLLFYCHFPDKCLAPHEGKLRKAYRAVFDRIEEWTTSRADKIVVNSKFTRSVVRESFPTLRDESLDVVYPCVATNPKLASDDLAAAKKLVAGGPFFLSVNRFERKKHIELAIEAYAKYISQTDDAVEQLVVAGGYDPRVDENIGYLKELQAICDEHKLSYGTVFQGTDGESTTTENKQVLFLASISSGLKDALLETTDILLYTPTREHFGIVPLEAMSRGTLVLADNTGGPLETIVNYADHRSQYTGFTVQADADKWNSTLKTLKSFSDAELSAASDRCRQRIDDHFSMSALQSSLCDTIDDFEPKVFGYEKQLPYVFGLSGAAVLALAVASAQKSH